MTINRKLETSNIGRRSKRLKPLVADGHLERRMTWARKNLYRDWDNVIFTNKASFWV